MISIAYYALVRMEDVKGGDDAAQARWFAVNEIPTLAFDHDRILRAALLRLYELLRFRLSGFTRLLDIFSVDELQSLCRLLQTYVTESK